MTLIWIVAASILVSLVSLIGIFTLLIKQKFLDKLLILLVGLAAGVLMGSAFLHLLPEALEKAQSSQVFIYTLFGFTCFFLLERYFHWRHCHEGTCDVHAFTYLNLAGDSIHNFIDGLLLASGFINSIELGLIATMAILLHEIPQELGDFAVLLYGGIKWKKALLFNFLTALTAVLGAISGYFLASAVHAFSQILIPFAAGGFIYIASSDLIPELHKQSNIRRANLSLAMFLLGLALTYLAKSLH